MRSSGSCRVGSLLLFLATGCHGARGRELPSPPPEGATTMGAPAEVGTESSDACVSGCAANTSVPHWPMPNPPASALPHPASYDTSEPGVVTDTITGLMWQRDVPSDSVEWEGAKAYCARLTIGKYDDWRLPARIELVSLVDFTRKAPALDELVFPGTRGNFWTSSPSARGGSPPRAWHVSFANGATSIGGSGVAESARCVRSTAHRTPNAARYEVNGERPNDTVRDLGTGLVWQRTLDESGHTFEGARAYCAGLTLGGGGFRVPSMKELQTLVEDAKEKSPVLDENAFPETPAGRTLFWTSSGSATAASAAWFVNFATGESADATATLGDIKNLENKVRCVR